jgi:hypothetical protein
VLKFLLKYIFVVFCFFVFTNVQAQTVDEEAALPEDVEQMLDSISVDSIASQVASEDEEQEYNEDETLALQELEKGYATRKYNEATWRADTSLADFNYVRPQPKPKKQTTPPKASRNWTMSDNMITMIIYGLIAIILIAAIYAFFGDSIFGRVDKKPDEHIEAGWEDVENFTEWERAVNEAEAAGDYRLAIRIHFLQCLQDLSQSGLIEYKKDNTNSVYINQMRSTKFSKRFMQLCRMFDYTWYGKYGIDQVQYQQTKSQFKQFSEDLA